MLKIRLTGKRIVAFLMGCVLVAVLVYAVMPKWLYKMASSAEQEAQREAYYNYLINNFPKTDEGIRALFFSAQQAIPGVPDGDEAGLIYIFPGSTGMSGGNLDKQKVKEAIKKFKFVRERAPESPWSIHALYELGKAHFILGDYKNAERYFLSSIEKTEMGASGSTQCLIEIYLVQHRYQEALALAEKSLAIKPGHNTLEMLTLKGRALIALEQWDAAQKTFEDLPDKARAIYGEHLADQGKEAVELNTQEYSNISAAYLRRLAVLRKDHKSVGTIAGKVMVDGQPFNDVRVYLIDKALYQDYYTGSTRGLPREITNSSGEYSFEGLAPGRYTLGVGVRVEDMDGFTLQQWKDEIIIEEGQTVTHNLNFVPTIKLLSPVAGQVVDGRIIFRWQPVQSAVRYELFLGPVFRDHKGNISTEYTIGLEAQVEGSEATIDLEKERMKLQLHGGIAYSNGVNPESILGLLRRGGEYTWGVYAYDQAGNRVSDSSGVVLYNKREIPIFRVKGEPSAADKLLLARQYDKSIEAYKATLKKNPWDPHALVVLARIYQYGVKYDEKNLEESTKYYQRLLQVMDHPEVKNALAEVYFQTEKFAQAKPLFEATIGTDAESWHTHLQLAKIKFHQGQPKDALEMIEKALKLRGGQYARVYPVALALMLDEPARALKIARQVDEGENYVRLLEQYVNRGYKANDTAKAKLMQGDYQSAKANLTTTSQDQFVRALLTYLTEGQRNTEDIKILSDSIEDALLTELLRKMLL